ncbi:MAG: hypothetical protein H6606_07735 [Flavobacteriales bacterium]|nr:hypothetical protein [Flavobacteriales bacterium]
MEHPNKPMTTRIAAIWIVLFSVAFAMVESAVVIYLRALYYPDGFQFPLRALSLELAYVELFRELATLIMITGIAWIAGRNLSTRFAWFLIVFAVWDIFYYVFLKIFLNWPEGWLDWDILFLLPTVWTGPVLAPVLLSILMIVLGVLLLKHNRKWHAPLNRAQWLILTAGALGSIVAFVFDFVRYQTNGSRTNSFDLSDAENWLQQYVPSTFPWPLFVASSLLILFAIYSYHDSQRILSAKLNRSQWF